MPKKTRTQKHASAAAAPNPGPVGSEQQYRRFLPEAQKLAPGDIRPLRADVSLAIANAQRGVAAVLGHEDRLRRDLPGVSLAAVKSHADLGLGLAFAAGVVARFAPPESDVKKLIARAHELRSLLLASADALAQARLLPAASVAKIGAGVLGF